MNSNYKRRGIRKGEDSTQALGPHKGECLVVREHLGLHSLKEGEGKQEQTEQSKSSLDDLYYHQPVQVFRHFPESSWNLGLRDNYNNFQAISQKVAGNWD